MATGSDFKKGDKVQFKAGPKSTTLTTAKVVGASECGKFLVTKDDGGVERKARPGSCTKVAA